MLGIRPLRPGLGVENGELEGREGEETVREIDKDGEKLELGWLTSLLVFSFPELNCAAVIFAYLAALDPGVILSGRFFASSICPEAKFEVLMDFTGVTPGVVLPFILDGVIQPLRGVTRPLERGNEGIREASEGVIRPENDVRPLFEEETEGARGKFF